MSNPRTQAEIFTIFRDIGLTQRQSRVGSAIAICEAPVYEADEPTADFGKIGDIELANETWGYSYGGMQIRSLRAEKGTGGYRDEDELLKVRFNCRAAREIMRAAGGWRPWSTYRSGAFKAYLQDIFPPPPGVYIVLAGDTLSGIAEKLGGFDWEELARINNIHAPYDIFIGQPLYLPGTVEGPIP